MTCPKSHSLFRQSQDQNPDSSTLEQGLFKSRTAFGPQEAPAAEDFVTPLMSGA